MAEKIVTKLPKPPSPPSPTSQKTKTRYQKWIAAGRPKMADWVKSGAGIGGPKGPKGVESSKLLQTRLKGEKTKEGKQGLMNRYDSWLQAGRPKMADWVKMGAGKEDLKKAAANRLTGGK
jgi:hypothetical protein